MRSNRRGFSLVELLLAVAIILVIIAIGTPYYLRSMQIAHDAGAVAYLRQLQTAQENYRATHGEYADGFTDLMPFITNEPQAAALWNTPTSYGFVPLAVAAPMEPFAFEQDDQGDDDEEVTPLGQGGTPPGQGQAKKGSIPPGQAKKGATFREQTINSMYIFELTRLDAGNWECTAEPVRDRTANRYYFTDNSGVIRFAVGSLADASSPPI